MPMAVRRSASSYVAEFIFHSIASVGALFPVGRPGRHGVRVIKNVAYKPSGGSHHTLDILCPAAESAGPRPVVLFVHGGSFMMLSKDTHRALAMQFAKAGCVVFNVNYRLAPADPFPNGLEDVCDAWLYMLDHAAEFGGDPTRAVVTGESAGGNLVSALVLASVWRRPEAFAAKVFDRGVVPLAALPFCPMLSVSRPRRFIERKPGLSQSISSKIEAAGRIYLQDVDHGESVLLADPLVALQSDHAFERALPPFFVAVGTRDPILDDSRQMAAALAKRNAACELRVYQGGIHAFHGFIWQAQAQACWRDALAFTAAHVQMGRDLAASPTAAAATASAAA